MGENSEISWTDHTFNPWIGCAKVSEGCQHCYAETLNNRYGWAEWGKSGTRKRTSEANWRRPIAWNKRAGETGVREKVFCASLADVFEDRPELEEWRVDLLKVIYDTPNLDWLLLTKRPENVNRMIEDANNYYPASDIFQEVPNMIIGTSVENQEQADKRIPELLNIPASKHFLSMEPLLGAVDLHFPERPNPNNDLWVIVGGESGNGARPIHPDWVRSLRDQCVGAGVPFFFKQWGELKPFHGYPHAIKAESWIHKFKDGSEHGFQKVGKKKAGCVLDGREWKECPRHKVREEK